MKAALINNLAGSYGTIQNQAIWDKASYYGLTRFYLDARFAQRTDIDYIHSRNLEAGLLRVSNWASYPSGAAFADACSQDITNLGNPGQCVHMLDIEQHDPQFVTDAITEFGARRPQRRFAWTLEPMQGGWFTDQLVTTIDSHPNLTVIHQNYGGSMQPFAADVVRQDLLTIGVNAGQLQGFYDGKGGPPVDWDGVVFTLERMS